MTDRTARRLFDRLVRLSAARELTGLRSGCMAYERRVAPVPATECIEYGDALGTANREAAAQGPLRERHPPPERPGR